MWTSWWNAFWSVQLRVSVCKFCKVSLTASFLRKCLYNCQKKKLIYLLRSLGGLFSFCFEQPSINLALQAKLINGAVVSKHFRISVILLDHSPLVCSNIGQELGNTWYISFASQPIQIYSTWLGHIINTVQFSKECFIRLLWISIKPIILRSQSSLLCSRKALRPRYWMYSTAGHMMDQEEALNCLYNGLVLSRANRNVFVHCIAAQ